MRPLNAFLEADFSLPDASLKGVDLDSGRRIDREDLRGRLLSSGRRIGKLDPDFGGKQGSEIGFLCGDSSNAVRELRYHALWGVHSTCVYAVFDGMEHDDLLVGQGKVSYRDLLYSSEINVGSLLPYSEVDSRVNSIRVFRELSMMLKCVEELSSEGKRIECILMDGSIQTNLHSLVKKGGNFNEDLNALETLKELMGFRNLVGLVEDSHATDLAGELGFDYTNMLLFDVALSPGEYVVDERDGVFICYLKLPSKTMDYLPSRTSSPLTVRWEFNKKDFTEDLNMLAGVWAREDDLLHPQLYPLRVSDYLTRRVKVGGLLDSVIRGKGLDLRYRDLREG